LARHRPRGGGDQCACDRGARVPRYTRHVFDIGVPELAVIAIVALVVLGPERLPEVMKQAGKWYRQAMNFRAELMSQVADAQRTFREEMEAVERAANVNLDEVAPDPVLPPPALRQVPSYRRQPDKAHEAGPFGLPAWYRDMSPDVDVPALTAPRGSPLALIRTVGDTLLGNAYVTSSRSLVAPVHPFDDPHDPSGAPIPSTPQPTLDESAAAGMRNAARGVRLEQSSDGERTMREGTVVTLYEAGLHTKESAASVLEIPVVEFERLLVERVKAAEVTVA
jgi:sec-independent protein translocase protein TatB